MNTFELFIIAIGLSMDAFAVAICIGIAIPTLTIKNVVIVGLYFGVFQAVMPLIGYVIGTQFADSIAIFADWIAFAVLCSIGIKMIMDGMKKTEEPKIKNISLRVLTILPLAIATSIDALAVGVSFAVLQVDIVPAVVFIGFTTFTLSFLGAKLGHTFGARFKFKPELAGGIILILMGLRILIEKI